MAEARGRPPRGWPRPFPSVPLACRPQPGRTHMGPCRNRRDFLRIAGASLAAPLVGSPLRAAVPASKPTSPVCIARCKTYDRETLYRELAALMDRLGGLEKLVSGKTVAVKVNLTGSPDQPACGLPPRR